MEEADRELYESYSAQCLWTIASALYSLGGMDFDMPQYIDMTRPALKKEQPTAQDIKDHVLARLTEVQACS